MRRITLSILALLASLSAALAGDFTPPGSKAQAVAEACERRLGVILCNLNGVNELQMTNLALSPVTNDGLALGTSTLGWADLFLATGGVVNWAGGGMTITESADQMQFQGATADYVFDDAVRPSINDGAQLGDSTRGWADLFLAGTGVIDWAQGDCTMANSNTNQMLMSGDCAWFLQTTASLGTPFIYWGTNAANGPVMMIDHQSASPAVGDFIGILEFRGRDAGLNLQTFGSLGVIPLNVTDTTEAGVMWFATANAGTNSFDVGVFRGFISQSGAYFGFNDDTDFTTSINIDTRICRDAAGTVSINTNACGTRGTLETNTIELGADTDTTIARSAAGEATLEGDAVKHAGKQMMWIPAGAMKNSSLNPASCGDTYDSGSNDVTISVCAFDTGATEEKAEFQVAMPKGWNESTVTFIPVSACSGACAASETVQFELSCVAVSVDDTINAAMGTAQTSSDTLPTTPTNDLLSGAESSAITCGGSPAENDVIMFRVSRDTSVDNMAGDALLIGVKLFWTDNAATLAE